MIVNTGLSVTDYFKQKMQAKLQPSTEDLNKLKKKGKKVSEEVLEASQEEAVDSAPPKKKRKRAVDESQEDLIEDVLEKAEETPKVRKKSKKIHEEGSVAIAVENSAAQASNKEQLKKSKQEPNEIVEILDEKSVEGKKSKKSKKDKEVESPTPEPSQQSSKAPPKRSGEPDRPAGANAVYSTNVIQIPSHVAQKMSNVIVDKFKNSNLANIVGYGLSEDIEMKIVQTKMGDNSFNTDKYALYNMDRMTTRQKVNPRKIMSKIKRTKKSIQVI